MYKRLFLMAATAIFCTTVSVAQIFYKIEGNGLKSPSYLFGTHHMAPLSVIDSYNMAEIMDETGQTIGEIDMTQGEMSIALAMQSHLIAPPDSTLSKVIPADTLQEINKLLKKWGPMPGIDISMFEPMKPNVVATTITAGIMTQLMPDYNPENQLDSYFQKKAKESGKKVIGLESPEYQAQMLFDFMPISVQAQQLTGILVENPEKIVEIADRLNSAYMNGDLEGILKAAEDEEPKTEFDIALIDKRNANWLEILPSLMEAESSFIAVGALHLPGKNGLLQGLKNLGYTVEAIPMLTISDN